MILRHPSSNEGYTGVDIPQTDTHSFWMASLTPMVRSETRTVIYTRFEGILVERQQSDTAAQGVDTDVEEEDYGDILAHEDSGEDESHEFQSTVRSLRRQFALHCEGFRTELKEARNHVKNALEDIPGLVA